ncbi:Peptidoglycan glycosyltransferase [Stackebrandtia nassauensis DSM 44728]|uniref:Peptidoglycan glycosyltransferase n=1 Tax=Stackebrandtia nassauensis (strain DSM 44728 / CIP 108903 / NRRL B-16338 / NBRC 102104 / LLR-40K-21) TaxID=446470 RepID=D3Q771_STANL|nr:Peptidoglycan glycosyltransferase [Stackebrandtia nassauensis DSM 44728]
MRRGYSPRGHTVGDDGDEDRRRRAAVRRGGDALRPALRLVEGGAEPESPRRTARARERTRQKVAATPVDRQSNTRSVRARQTQRATATKASGPRRRVIKRRLPKIGNPKRRLRLGMTLILLIFAIAGGRLVQLQVTDAAAYAADALGQRLQEEIIPGSRGSILDRNGERLAFSGAARYVYADPELIEDPKKAADKLTPLLGIPTRELADKMKQTKGDGPPSRFEYLARGVDVEIGDKIEKLEIPGVRVAYDERREVPGQDLAANIIGFTGLDGNGLGGMEASYEDILAGRDGERKYEVSASGQEIPGGFHREEKAKPGSDLKLTVDSDLQYQVQRILSDTMAKKNAEFGAAVVMDADTGEVVSMASAPSYDAANPMEYDKSLRGDRATDSVVEPGSIHKAIVVGAALEEGIIDRDSEPVVGPTITKADNTYRDTHPHEKRPMTIGGILAHSSNVGTIDLADKLGPEKLYEYQKKFGLGAGTDVGVAGEAAGIVREPSTWQGSDFGSIPIGLGVAVTPLQMAAGYNAIANDGMYVQPSLVECTISPDGDKDKADAPKSHRVFSKKTARDLQYVLQGPIVVPDGTGTLAKIPGYNVAGKTGTGKLVRDGEYAPGEVASFVGFAPADKPEYTVAVFAYTPGGGGGEVTGTAFRDIMQYTLGHYRVPPSTEKPADIEVYPT